MKIKLIVVGKTQNDWLIKGITEYTSRLSHYISFEIVELPDLKKRGSLPEEKVKLLEQAEIEKHLFPDHEWIALDEHGKEYTSEGFAQWLEKQLIDGKKQLTFIVGGAFGISRNILDTCRQKMALSQMTFSHQMVRLLFVEQLYRALTIIKGEKYHHK